MAKGLMVVESSPPEGREGEFNDWYRNTHIPQILDVPGFLGARRYRISESAPQNQGSTKARYLALYELEADDLAIPLEEMRTRSAAGRMERKPEVLSTDPPPVVTIYELID